MRESEGNGRDGVGESEGSLRRAGGRVWVDSMDAHLVVANDHSGAAAECNMTERHHQRDSTIGRISAVGGNGHQTADTLY